MDRVPPDRCFRIAAAVLAATVSAVGSATAAAEGAGEEPAIGEVAPDSPRASVAAFLEHCRLGEWKEAAGYLDVPYRRRGRAPELARRLMAVLDRRVWIDPDALSPLSTGRRDDGLPAATDEIAQVPGPTGRMESVRVVRRSLDDATRWLFSRGTVDRIDDWYDTLEDRWIRDYLPEELMEFGPLGVRRWQWIAIPVLIGLAWAIGRLLRWFTVAVLRRVVRRTATRWDDALLRGMGPPITMAWAIGIAYAALPWIALPVTTEGFARRALSAGVFLVVFWVGFRAIGVAREMTAESEWARARPAVAALAPLAFRIATLTLFVIAVIAVVSEFGYPVGSLLAGLGIGGLALALAAQRTVENLFGSLSLGVDQPFRVGDFVRVDDLIGTVEGIGLRSTRIRTLDRTLVTIPNGKLAEARIETFGARDRIRLACTVRLEYGTSADQMRRIVKGIEDLLRGRPKIWPDTVVVRFKEFADSSLNIEVMAWFQTADWGEFLAIREGVLLGIMDVVLGAGAAFALPTRTVHLVGQPAAAEPKIG